MADKTGIEWTDATWSPVTGCDPISPGCKHCYAKREVEQRWSKNPKSVWCGRDFNDVQCHAAALVQPLRWAKPRKIFVCPRADLFHDDVPFEFIAAIFGAMSHARRHTFQVLTKRPARMLGFFAWLSLQTEHKAANAAAANHAEFICGEERGRRGAESASVEACAIAAYYDRAQITNGGRSHGSYYPHWPLPNVWIGVSIEGQDAADERIPLLLQAPAAVRWISAEPLLGPVSLRWLPAFPENAPHTAQHPSGTTNHLDGLRRLDWVVVGGESGPKARPMHPQWARDLRDQCAAAGVPFHFKQWGEWAPPTKAEDLRFLGDLMRAGKAVHVYGNGREPDGHFRRGDDHLLRVGKKAAGRLLDGVLHDKYPTP